MYDTTTTYSAVCQWVTGEGKKGERIHLVTHKRTAGVNSVVSYDARERNQITGFTLHGFGATTTTGTVPVEGGACVGNEDGVNHNGTWVSVVPESTTGGLSVAHGGSSVPLG
ncbi:MULTISPECIES: hypothetical protein [unclassified Streptomyces]|uniref:hypothetical protein n=1 Tax=unclassified Streptomyces TaxID=2593676 RepID=UPI00166214DA|nr:MULTISPECIES: hypothetical protein [unclassified Streptomyces]MBD0843232.1 hypothetical protein [Streptomyces sp. TRM68416]